MNEVIRFNGLVVPVYYDGNEDNPIFKIKDIGVKYSILDKLEDDEWFKSFDGDIYVTELGLYNLLSQMQDKNARLWRRVVHQQLIELRKQKQMSVSDQFNEWDEMAGEYYFDEESGRMMRNVTVEGGDVIQVPA